MLRAMKDVISTVADLEAVVGAAPLPVKMKIIDHLDATASEWISASTLAFVGIGKPDGPRVTLAGKPPGFARTKDRTTLVLPLDALDDPDLPQPGDGAGVLCLVPGLGETLRANGRVKSRSNVEVEIAIEECFVHCAKALIRSEFWNAALNAAPGDAIDYVNASRFLALATMDKRGLIDISPKGDPAGLLIRSGGGRATLAERPGNRLAFGYRNIIEEPRVCALAIVPGASTVAIIEGRAHLSTNEAERAAFTVDEKMPKLVNAIDDIRVDLRSSAALSRAAPWAGEIGEPVIDAAAALVAHVKLNKEDGVQATMMRLAVNRGLVASGLKTSYKNDLY